MKDSIYATPRPLIADFAFDATVVAVFPDMIRRSVPGYGEIIALTGLIAGQHAQAGSNCYDLGCSLGASTLSMRRQIRQEGCHIIAVDNSEAMIERCGANLSAEPPEVYGDPVPVTLCCADMCDIEIENASVVVFNFTLQFLPPAQRLALLTRVRQGMRPGGVLVLSEKVMFADPREQAFQEEMHLAFKRANGYSELEISQKRNALENVLIPETLATHQSRLEAAGFARSEVWFRCFNFASLVAFA